MKEGIITMLFKQQATRDIHTYRPITLLNTELLAKVLVERFRRMMDTFVIPQQAGFIPGIRYTIQKTKCEGDWRSTEGYQGNFPYSREWRKAARYPPCH